MGVGNRAWGGWVGGGELFGLLGLAGGNIFWEFVNEVWGTNSGGWKKEQEWAGESA